MSLSSPLTVIGMINGMIGGFILILPVNALHAGWLFTLLVILVVGGFSYYSCYLCVIHLGDQKDLDYAMYVHFNKSKFVKVIYDLTVFSNLLFLGFLYFQLICIQWEGIIGKESIANPLSNAAVLFILIFVLKYFEFGASIMAYGIVSIVGYVLFLIWVIVTAPQGDNTWKTFGSGQINLAAAMGGAFSIQTFFIPILKRNLNQSKYSFFTLIAYIAGSSVYFYIAFIGTFGILNRTPAVSNPQTIEQFFQAGRFQLSIIQSIYLIHLYSVFPEFTLISKKRFFSVFSLKQTQKGKIPKPQIIYALIFVGLCFIIRYFKVDINDIVDLNGSVIGFFFIYFLPAILHIRCLYFAKNKISFADKQALTTQNKDKQGQVNQRSNTKMQLGQYVISNGVQITQTTPRMLQKPLFSDQNQLPIFIKKDSNHQSVDQTVKSFRLSEYRDQLSKKQEVDQVQHQQESQFFACDVSFYHYFNQCRKPTSKVLQVVQLFVIFCMISLGAFILVNGVMTVG